MTGDELANKLGVTQATVSTWEKGISSPNADNLKQLLDSFGEAAFEGEYDPLYVAEEFAKWVRDNRSECGWTQAELARKAGVTQPTIASIEAGKTASPQPRTIARLSEAFSEQLPETISEGIEEAAKVGISGIGKYTDFDPHDEENLPHVAGIYVLYDVTDRAVYIGESADIGRRIRDEGTGHWNKFYFRRPVVETAAYIEVADETLRKQIERVMIKLLRSNAVLNKQNVIR
jgi:transcriptional regulator with XRE-family HTH domain